MTWHWFYLAAGAAALAAGVLATLICRKLARRFDVMDRPKQEAHKLHAKATPLLGGMAIFAAWSGCIAGGYFAVCSGWFDGLFPALAEHREGMYSVSWRMLALLAGAAMAAGLGLLDDCKGLSAAPKFAGQFLVALVAVVLGGMHFTLFIDNIWVTGALTVFWYMLLMNAINFFDNLDGLAVGTATIALALFALVSAWHQQYFMATLSALSCGAAAGFWCFNRAPASIYMGDSGSHFLGYLLATISTGVTYYSSASSTGLTVLMPLFILALPLFDTMAVVAIRLRRRKPFWIGDHNHISHRFVRMGMSRPLAVGSVHLLALIIGLSVIPLLWVDRATATVLFVQAILLLLLVTLLQAGGAKNPSDGPVQAGKKRSRRGGGSRRKS